jgi:hypothetical protein
MSRKRGMWVNFGDAPARSSSLGSVHLGAGSISTCFALMNEPVLTNGKIGSVSDTVDVTERVIVGHQTSPTQSERDQA